VVVVVELQQETVSQVVLAVEAQALPALLAAAVLH
jgi:hypothetical protein